MAKRGRPKGSKNQTHLITQIERQYSEGFITFMIVLLVMTLGVLVWWMQQQFVLGMETIGVILGVILLAIVVRAVMWIYAQGEQRGIALLGQLSDTLLTYAERDSINDTRRERRAIESRRLERTHIQNDTAQKRLEHLALKQPLALPLDNSIDVEWKVVNDPQAQLTIIK